MALEVAALQANAIERDEREVTKDNSAIMARDKGCEGQRIHIQNNTQEPSRIFPFPQEIMQLEATDYPDLLLGHEWLIKPRTYLFQLTSGQGRGQRGRREQNVLKC